MNCSLSIPFDTIDRLRCSTCGNSLSYFPLYLTEDNENVCGRCASSEEKNGFRNKALEEVVRHIRFPCRYKDEGCHQEFQPPDVPSHEKNCNHKTVKCPGVEFTGCSWQGARKNMPSHCRQAHKDVFLKDNAFKLNVNVLLLLDKFVEHDGTLFVVSMRFNCFSQTLFFVVHHLEEEVADLENHSYQLVLRKDEKTVIVGGVTTAFSERKTNEVALDSLTKNSKDQNGQAIAGCITFENDDPVPRKRFKQDLLSFLKCSQCEAFILPPIDQSEDQKTKCTSCDALYEMKMFNLAGIAETLDFPCRYKKNGCDVVLKSEKMRRHLSVCPFADEKCGFCKWKGLKNGFTTHILETHKDVIVENGARISVENKYSSLSRVICYSDHLFVLMFRIGESTYSSGFCYKWAVTIISNVEDEFLYEIDFVNVKDKGRLTVQNRCVPYKDYRRQDNCSVTDINSLLQWQNLDYITFKICIFKQ